MRLAPNDSVRHFGLDGVPFCLYKQLNVERLFAVAVAIYFNTQFAKFAKEFADLSMVLVHVQVRYMYVMEVLS